MRYVIILLVILGGLFMVTNQKDYEKVHFKNRYGITLAGDLYLPQEVNAKLPAIAISGPFGAVKEQASGLYAREMAKEDLSHWHLTLHIPEKAVESQEM